MTPDQRARAGRAVAARINEMDTTVTAIARAAGVDAKTLRSLIAGRTWPTMNTRGRIAKALHWPAGQIARCAVEDPDPKLILQSFRSLDLLDELCRRAKEYEKTQRR